MQIAFKITLFSMCLALAMSAAPLARSARVELNLVQMMMQSNDGSPGSTRNMACFGYYIPLINDILNEYETNFAKCLSTAEAAREVLDSATSEEKAALILASQQSCAALESCSQKNTSLDLFECFSNTGGESARTMYTISANASELYSIVFEDYRQVDVEQSRCTSAAERTYVEETTRASDDLAACLSGQSPVPTQSAPTTTTSNPTEGDTTTDDTTVDDWTTMPSPEVRVAREAPRDDAPENKRNYRIGRIMSKLSESI